MKIEAYREGDIGSARTFDTDDPAEAALMFGEQWTGMPLRSLNVVVRPADDEARASVKAQWRSDEEEPHFVLYRIEPSVTWDAYRVEDFWSRR